MIIRDKCGNVIQAGDYIVYGHESSSSARLKFGKILKIVTEPFGTTHYHGPYMGWAIKITVQGIDDGNIWYGKPGLSGRGILRYPERIIKLPFEVLPQYAKHLLKDIDHE